MTFFTTFVLGMLLLSCGGDSHTIPEAYACKEASKAMCAKVFSCDDVISVLARAALGGTQARCEDLLIRSSCTTSWCQPNQTYHGDRAYECKQHFAMVECGTLDATALTGNIASVLATATACAQVCTTDDAGFTPGG